MTMEATPLLTPYKMGGFNLAHRVVLAPVTRCRSYGNMAEPHNALYYAQRAMPGVVLIAEASTVSEMAPGYPPVPGLWSQEQAEAWKPVVDAVHAKGALFFCQIWHTGSVSPTELDAPLGLEAQEIPRMVNDFLTAARNASKAGFDGVDIHATSGLLINQFWWFLDAERSKSQPLHRNDQLIKDSVDNQENHRRFATEAITAVADEVGAHRLGVRLSPVADYDSDSEALPLHVIRLMNDLGVLYCHMVEPRNGTPRSLLPFRKAFKGTFIVNGGDGYADLVSYGWLFLANPDLPERFRKRAGAKRV